MAAVVSQCCFSKNAANSPIAGQKKGDACLGQTRVNFAVATDEKLASIVRCVITLSASARNPSMRERRQHHRFPVQIPAKIMFDCFAAIDCVIVDQSASGAGLEVQDTGHVPDAFESS